MPDGAQGVLDSSHSFLKNAQSLQSVLENIPVAEETWQFLENTLDTIGDVSSL